jgi:hypothetical protein
MLSYRMRFPLLASLGIAVAALAVGFAGCIFSPPPDRPPIVDRDPIPPPTTPDNLIAALEVIYNNTARNAQERLLLYEDRISESGFRFRFQPSDVGTDPGGTGVPIPPDWGRDEEIRAHERLFTAQQSGAVYSLTLDIERQPAEEIDPPEEGKEGWRWIWATNVQLRLMFNANDGLEVTGGQAEFYLAPDDPDQPTRWWIGEWVDRPRV